MKVPPRVIVPVLLALFCAAALVAFLWWQLTQATILLSTQGSGGEPLIQQGVTSLEDEPVDPRNIALIHLRQGDLFFLRGEWEAAETQYQDSVKAGGGLSALRKLAQVQIQRRDIAGVRSTIRKLKAEGARSEDTLLLEAILNLRTGELVRARTQLTAADESPQKHYGMALLSIIEGSHTAAKEELDTVINGWEPILRSYARTLKSAYDEYTLFPDSADIHLVTLLSRALAQVQECELALPLLLQVTDRRDDYRDAWIVQGYCELTTERSEAALASLERAYGLDPQKPEIQYFLARTYADLSDHKNAITFFEYALINGFQPEAEVRRLTARSALESDQPELALEQYDALTQMEDATIESFEGYTHTALMLGKNEEALQKALQATELWKEKGKSHELLGRAQLALGDTNSAKQSLMHALELNPFLSEAKQKLQEL